MTLPKIPDGKDWTPETWRAGLDEAVRLCAIYGVTIWQSFFELSDTIQRLSVIAHATTLIEAGIVKPVVSEAEQIYNELQTCMTGLEKIAVINAVLDKARAGK